MNDMPILEVKDLDKYYSQTTNVIESVRTRLRGEDVPPIRAVDSVNLRLETDEVQGIVGESGCGKSTLLATLMNLEEPTSGEIYFDGTPVSEFNKQDWKEFRRRVQIILQDPFNSMNPKLSVRETLAEPLNIHGMSVDEERLLESLEKVDLLPPENFIDRRERELSGGEKQRVSIARALVTNPDLILADEPVSMLDVSTQASILDLMNDLTDSLGVSMLYISHDLATVPYICDRVNVMYLGRIVESSPTDEIISNPKHPYTQALINAAPIPDPHYQRERTQLSGQPPKPKDIGQGCRFKNRCPDRMEICNKRPDLIDLEEDSESQVACHLYYNHELRDEERGERSDVVPGGVEQ
ncbi:oligopeptide/dipeptide ABC transporter ATP-binding protein [Halopenitus persicus]|uniref:oligopeptide/dipeptide ABC transporter ATP-binding protein n=1 Tax=Halopenitus persicus TaxID=1048396 RepID=UPI000BBA7C04|nr:ABC transporter ATP-binding protein [Halopenitus persicus]